jgi:dTDP-4-dehydrorhamnose reductase
MLGHSVLVNLRSRHDVRVTLRKRIHEYAHYKLFDSGNAFGELDVRDADKLQRVLASFRPDAVVNAVGLVKQRDAARDVVASIEINALFPHRLAQLCRTAGSRLIHFSTDCVFAGNRGQYRETDPCDATDLYGRSKALGEVDEPGCMTLRTSIIGLELANKHGLVEWYLAQQGEIRGFARAIYTGLNTLRMSLTIEHILLQAPQLHGVWHVASDPISKYDLLVRLTQRLGRRDVLVTRDDEFVCDRSLDGSAFARTASWCAPSWDQMIDDLAEQIERRGKNAA